MLQTALQGEDDALAKVNFDPTKLSESALNSFDTPTFQAASDKVDAYVKNTCGIDTGDDVPTSTP